MYVLPIVLIFSTPLNFGLDSSCRMNRNTSERDAWRTGVSLQTPLDNVLVCPIILGAISKPQDVRFSRPVVFVSYNLWDLLALSSPSSSD